LNTKTIGELAGELQKSLHHLKHTHLSATAPGEFKPAEHFTFVSLFHLSKDGQKVKPSALAKKIGVTCSAVTHQINSLEKKGYITRSSSKDDRRVVYISISEKGYRMKITLEKYYRKQLEGLVEYLGEDDCEKLVFLLNKLTDYMRRQMHHSEEE